MVKQKYILVLWFITICLLLGNYNVMGQVTRKELNQRKYEKTKETKRRNSHSKVIYPNAVHGTNDIEAASDVKVTEAVYTNGNLPPDVRAKLITNRFLVLLQLNKEQYAKLLEMNQQATQQLEKVREMYGRTSSEVDRNRKRLGRERDGSLTLLLNSEQYEIWKNFKFGPTMQDDSAYYDF